MRTWDSAGCCPCSCEVYNLSGDREGAKIHVLGAGAINSPDQEVTETGVFGVGVRPTKCFNTHRGSVFSSGKGRATA